MAYAPYHNGQLNGRTRIAGAFNEKDIGNRFEFTRRTDAEIARFASDYPDAVFVGAYGAEETRAARVLKTVAYIVVDEDADGEPVVEKWAIKNFIAYREAA